MLLLLLDVTSPVTRSLPLPPSPPQVPPRTEAVKQAAVAAAAVAFTLSGAKLALERRRTRRRRIPPLARSSKIMQWEETQRDEGLG